jgi:dCTP deaminase
VILADWEIRALIEGQQMVENYHPGAINPASLDVRLGARLQVEQRWSRQLRTVDISRTTPWEPYLLKPGHFVLAETKEVFNLPDHVAAQFVLKSSRAREGIQHLLAGWCDPGWHGSVLTMELKNVRRLHAVPIWHRMPIGQMKFLVMSSRPQRSYALTGRYNGDRTVMGSKG